MKRTTRLFTTFVAATAILGLTACGGDPLAEAPTDDRDTGSTDEPSSVIVGSADFAESQLLATVYALALEDIGVEVAEKPNIGSREVYLTALTDGSIDLIPEYNGYLLQELDAEADTSDRQRIFDQLIEKLPDGVTVLDWADAENTNVLVVTQEFSDEHGGLETISDLAAADDGSFTLAGPPEWRTRPKTGVPGIRDTYGLDFENRYQILDGGGPLSLAAVVNGQVDVTMLLSSDPAIADNALVALEDDQVIFPPANIMPMISEDVLTEDIEAQLNRVTAALTIDDLMSMNGRVNEGDDFQVIAEDWLTEVGIL